MMEAIINMRDLKISIVTIIIISINSNNNSSINTPNKKYNNNNIVIRINNISKQVNSSSTIPINNSNNNMQRLLAKIHPKILEHNILDNKLQQLPKERDLKTNRLIQTKSQDLKLTLKQLIDPKIM